MKRFQMGFYDFDFTSFFIWAAVIGGIFDIGLSFFVPWLWSLVKPIIHSLTA